MGKAKRKMKDPHKPKRALTGFMFFSKDRRPKLMEENPGIIFTEVGKKLGQEWKELDDAAKAPYEAQAEADKERYAQEMASYVPDERYITKSKRKDPNRPKRAMSAYLYFCKAHRESVKAEFPDKIMVEVQAVLGKRWKETTEAERVPFVKQAEADRERYDKEMLKQFGSQQQAEPSYVDDEGDMGLDEVDEEEEEDMN
ncbi:High mobility group-T protein (HMG-T) (HMG-T1) (HMG-1) [Durusdinium trenchii]|uniref:High mobility group-T protein (HMG-T) (HMG-T1) (HMG-1) n=1 Tax=Durusdinium trenchii TaxID=1381693 RepID=A0ABP0LCX9_9DINO